MSCLLRRSDLWGRCPTRPAARAPRRHPPWSVSCRVSCVPSASWPSLCSPCPSGMATADAATLPKPPTKTLPSRPRRGPALPGAAALRPAGQAGRRGLRQADVEPLQARHAPTGASSATATAALTEHSEGRAWDWMLSVNKPNEKAIADAVTAVAVGARRPGSARRHGPPVRDHVHHLEPQDVARLRPGARLGRPTPGRCRTPTTSTSRSRGTAPTAAPPGGPARPSRRSSPGPASAPKPTTPPQTAVGRLLAAHPGRDRPRRGARAEGHRRHAGRGLRPEDGGRPEDLAGRPRRQGDRPARPRDLGEDGGAQADPAARHATTRRPRPSPRHHAAVTPAKPPTTTPASPLAAYAKLTMKKGATGPPSSPCRRRSASPRTARSVPRPRPPSRRSRPVATCPRPASSARARGPP